MGLQNVISLLPCYVQGSNQYCTLIRRLSQNIICFYEGIYITNGLVKTRDNDLYSNYIVIIMNFFNLVLSNFLLGKVL